MGFAVIYRSYELDQDRPDRRGSRHVAHMPERYMSLNQWRQRLPGINSKRASVCFSLRARVRLATASGSGRAAITKEGMQGCKGGEAAKTTGFRSTLHSQDDRAAKLSCRRSLISSR
jgi:hypothetical protein